MVDEVLRTGEREKSSLESSPHPMDPETEIALTGSEKERALILAAEIALLKSKIQNTEHILQGVKDLHDKQKAQLSSWQEELAALKEGQLLLGVE